MASVRSFLNADLGDLQENHKQTAKKRKMQSRYPLTIIDGETSCGFNYWHFIHPEAVHSERKMYEIDWLNAEEGILKAENAPGEFYEKALALLKPLDCLVYDGVLKEWTYKSDDAENSLNVFEKILTEGFVADMASCRGRAFVYEMLSKWLPVDNMRVINCGGRSTVNEPTVRSMHFSMKQSVVDSDWSSRELSQNKPILQVSRLDRASPCISQESELQQPEEPKNIVICKKFVTDVIVEDRLGEVLIVEVKKGCRITHTQICQLKYMLLPTAIKEGSALGLLICSKEAKLIKYICEGNNLIFGQALYKFRDNFLVKDLVHLMLDLQSNILYR